MCSTTSALVNRADREHNPISGSTRAAVISSQPGGSSRGRSRQTARSKSVPDGQADLFCFALPPPGQQARGQRVVLRRPGGQAMPRRRPASAAPATHTPPPLASSSASIWALRLENARSWARVKPSISRVLCRSGPSPPPAARTGSAADGSGRSTRPPGPTRTTGPRRRPHGGRRRPAAPGSAPDNACATEDRPPGSFDVRTRPPPNPSSPPAGAPPADCTRATAARSSRNPSATSTASRWAAATVSATGSEPSAHNSDTLFGAENVRSNASTERGRDPASKIDDRVVGCLPSTRARSWSASTTPDSPRRLRPPARPHPRRLAHAGVVLVDAQRHRRDQILRVRQPRHRQHLPPPPTPSPSTTTTANLIRRSAHRPSTRLPQQPNPAQTPATPPGRQPAAPSRRHRPEVERLLPGHCEGCAG